MAGSFFDGGIGLDTYLLEERAGYHGIGDSANPVLDALIEWEATGKRLPFEFFHSYRSVDWSRFPDCDAARKALLSRRRAEVEVFSRRRRLSLGVKKCKQCGVGFLSDYVGKHYCGQACYDAARGVGRKSVCEQCGVEYSVAESRAKQFCSVRCLGDSRAQAFYELNGLRLSVGEWARRIGVDKKTLLARHRRGVPAEKALTSEIRVTSRTPKERRPAGC